MATDDVLINKCALIERSLARIREEYIGKEPQLRVNFTVQDSIILNLQRACETAIDLANYEVRRRKLGNPQNSRDAFDLLASSNVLERTLADRMKKMVWFRNHAVHEYSTLNLDIVESIIREHLEDFTHFTSTLISQR